MRTLLAIGLLSTLLSPSAAWADRNDDRERREEWREQQEELRERQEERAEEARERYEKQQKEWRKYQEKMRGHYGHDHGSRQGRGYYPPPSAPRAPHYGNRYAYPPAPRYGEREHYRANPYPQHRHHDDDDDDDIDAVYTPWGYYEDYPKTPYDARRPRPEGRGQIGPFRFEVWK